ncbi:cardiolipin synthase [Peptoniphilus raoultii]|uniref:cardiolipin synthase n=1 Tax=Peptoniphilus raoultii TaxID=1776387 RepID=UPI0008DAB658|nr:cardiolipin synthase [Peptoniphilus raoultii]
MFEMYFNSIKSFAQVYSVIFLTNIIFSALVVFFERKKPTSTLLWVMAINFLPIIGIILYLILGQDISKSKMFEDKTKMDIDVKNEFKRQLEDIQDGEYVFSNPRTKEYKDIVEMFNMAEAEILYSCNEVKIYNNGPEKFKELFQDLRKARHTIYVQYYIFKSDNLSQEFIKILIDKAREGLKVYLLVDGMGARHLKYRDRRRIKEAGIEFAVFFPGILPKINSHINYRNHRKIAVIDKKIGYVGGLNVGDEYVGKGKFGNWRDSHLRIEGEAVNGLSWRFYLDFKFASSKDPTGFTTEIFEKKGNKDVAIVTSGPDTKADSIRNGYEKFITRATKEIYIQTPYFVPDEGLFKCLKVASLSGVKVNVMFPEKKDHPFVHWASLSYAGDLLKWGANVYMYRNGFLHTKVMISDDYLSTVGTANFDIRSFELNFEVNAFLFDYELNKKLKEDFKRDLKDCLQITEEMYKKRDVFTRIREQISRLLSPLL